jgi:HD-GYP domain-containing protein (c-di-GMP phosphodiesterase class II)
MISELKSIEAQLKQVLYGCVEHVQATKAALYLPASRDLSEKRYELVTHYQYNPADRKIVNANDDLVDRLAVKRSPFFVNGLGADQRLAEMLFQQGNDRILAAPLFSRGRLIGFIDMRDKAGRKPFEQADVLAAQKIADAMMNVLAKNKLFGIAPIDLVESTEPSLAFKTPHGTPAVALPPVQPLPRDGVSPAAQHAIDSARQLIARRQLNREATANRVLGEADLEPVRLVLPAALAIPGAQFGAFSAIGHMNNPQYIVARAAVGDAVRDKLQAHLTTWLKRVNQPPLLLRPQIAYPFGSSGELTDLGPIFSAPLNVYSVDGLVLTVAFERQPDAQAQRALRLMLRQLEHAVESVVVTASGRNERVLLAEKLLEPDFQKFSELAEHSREVSVIAQRFARELELPATQVETVRLAALVHDVGMRLLDYEKLYRRATLTPEEMRVLAEHPVVGAAIVEPLLGTDIAQAVLRHHERVDGKGYPSRMSGQQIPIASRIIQIVDAWVAMTSSNSYQTPIERDKATARLREGAGTQFDAALVERFLRGLTEIAP